MGSSNDFAWPRAPCTLSLLFPYARPHSWGQAAGTTLGPQQLPPGPWARNSPQGSRQDPRPTRRDVEGSAKGDSTRVSDRDRAGRDRDRGKHETWTERETRRCREAERTDQGDKETQRDRKGREVGTGIRASPSHTRTLLPTETRVQESP